MSAYRTTGFTLIELMVTVAVLAILTALALPSFQGTLRSNRIATTTNELLASISMARSEAIRSTHGGGVCTSTDGKACDGDWSSGWLVWTDSNGNEELDDTEPVIRYVQPKSRLLVSGSTTLIAFDSRGRSTSGEQEISLQPEGSVTVPARCLHISPAGQTRIVKSACK